MILLIRDGGFSGLAMVAAVSFALQWSMAGLLNEIISAIEADAEMKVVVFDGAVTSCFPPRGKLARALGQSAGVDTAGAGRCRVQCGWRIVAPAPVEF